MAEIQTRRITLIASDGLLNGKQAAMKSRALPRCSVIELVRTGAMDPTQILSHVEPLSEVIEAYHSFDKREAGWIKVELQPGA